MRIVDYLGSLEEERLNVLFSSENQKIRSLVSTFFKCKIPLEPTHGKKRVRAIVVRPLTRVSSKIVVGLLWHACYGRKFKVYHWFILFQVLTRTLKKDKNSEALLSALVILTANAGATRWQSNLKPLRSIFVQHYGEERGTRELDKLKLMLPYRLPEKGPIIDDLLEIKLGSILQRKPKELARIGVGYKDKGNLPKGFTLELPSSDFMEKEEIFEVLLRQVRAKYLSLLR